MKHLSFILCFLFVSCSYTNNSNSKEQQVYNNKECTSDSLALYNVREDSLISVVYEQFSKDNVIIEYNNKNSNSKNIVPAGYVKINSFTHISRSGDMGVTNMEIWV